MFAGFGKILVFIGGFLLILGFLLMFAEKIPFIGKLPGDFAFKGKNFSIYFPLATSLLLSLIISILLNFFGKK